MYPNSSVKENNISSKNNLPYIRVYIYIYYIPSSIKVESRKYVMQTTHKNTDRPEPETETGLETQPEPKELQPTKETISARR